MMAIHWLLSLVCLLASLVVAQDYYYSEGGPSDTAVTTKSVTETVTKYLSQCSPESTSSSISDTTLSSTTTITSTLESTISIVVTSNVSDASGAAPTGLTSSQSGISFTGLTYQPTVTGGGPCSGLNCSSAIANTTTSSCSTATGNLLSKSFCLGKEINESNTCYGSCSLASYYHINHVVNVP